MTVHTTHPGPSFAARHLGYAVAIAVNLVVLALVNVSPGWEAVGFLTPRMAEVLWLVNASLLVGVVANSAYSVYDATWLRALGDVATTGIGLAVMVRIWQVFPFDFDPSSFPWDVVARWLLGIGIFGSIIGIIVALVKLVRALAVR